MNILKRNKNDIHARARKTMVESHLAPRGIKDEAVIKAMLTVPRHLFLGDALSGQAYGDFPLPIGDGQTISQPFIVAFMSEALLLQGTEKVLEIGTGSGYQTAVLSMLAARIFSIERISSLAQKTRRLLDELGYTSVLVRVADGTLGWADEAPFDAIIVTAASPDVPKALTDQLAEGGRLVIPVGGAYDQELLRITKRHGSLRTERLGGCRFVKLIGKQGWAAEKP